MNSFEFNKIAGAVLASVLFILGVSVLADMLYETGEANPKAYEVAALVEEGAGEEAAAGEEAGAGEEAAAGEGAAEAPQEDSLATLLAQADAAAGAKTAKKCAACHNFEEGAGAKIGPDLYHVVGREVAAQGGFSYSSALKDHGGTWTFEELSHFIADPRGCVPGTAMSFAGIKKPQQRADLIAYLNTLGSNLPLPNAPAPSATDDGAETADDAPAADAPAADATATEEKSKGE
ncbi:MAG: cytochrome c family protein [Alphaproteobacteria bacterium HGW-Alphaproteobacteria-12]|nr:MAG: cytochrome c family protein [Alphaproteobacteria bacterium HGW-Alphaproteobacteria-12]